ncbi:MAG: cytochrome c [Deltaproteobacteria bacterium]|nr:cytochrome c [Deltaproteobacteria bacterium]
MSRSRTSSRRTQRGGRTLLAGLLLVAVSASTGCWEQMSYQWFPQMKRQRATQAFEVVTHRDQLQGFAPPEGTVPLTWGAVPNLLAMDEAQRNAVPNPVSANLASLKRGEVLFHRYCVTCHGPEGHGDGPLAGPPFGSNGPLGMVLPIGGPQSMAKVFSDGHLYATISLGRGRMPAYARITPEDRWNIINFVRDLNGQGGRQ